MAPAGRQAGPPPGRPCTYEATPCGRGGKADPDAQGPELRGVAPAPPAARAGADRCLGGGAHRGECVIDGDRGVLAERLEGCGCQMVQNGLTAAGDERA